MPTFIDESGDTGIKEESSACFRLAAVVFDSPTDVESYSACLSSLRADLRLTRDFEFHFAKIGHRLRMKFFEAFATMPFSFVASSIQKSALARADLSKRIVCEKATRGLIKHLEPQYLEIETRLGFPRGLKDGIVYDECDDPTFVRALKDCLKPLTAERPCGRKLVRGCRPGKSHVDEALQLADMICGATGKHLDGEGEYYRLLHGKSGVIEEIK
jgi:hypothetical protein